MNGKYFLIFTEGDSREDYSVFYSTLVIAYNEQHALTEYFKLYNIPSYDQHLFGAEEIDLIDLR